MSMRVTELTGRVINSVLLAFFLVTAFIIFCSAITSASSEYNQDTLDELAASQTARYDAELYSLLGLPIASVSVEAAPESHARVITYWISPFEVPVNLDTALVRVNKHTPAGFQVRLLVPGPYGTAWRSCRSVLCPKGLADVETLNKIIKERGLLFGTWTLPRSLTSQEGALHGQVAKAASGFNVLDLEPYPGFLKVPSKSPVDFLKAYSKYEPRVHISIVPQPSGIVPFKSALRLWILSAETIRPQLYYTDSPTLDPKVALPYLNRVLSSLHLRREIVPLLPGNGGAKLLQQLKQLDSVDVWRLLP